MTKPTQPKQQMPRLKTKSNTTQRKKFKDSVIAVLELQGEKLTKETINLICNNFDYYRLEVYKPSWKTEPKP